jgi:hypothetical protein
MVFLKNFYFIYFIQFTIALSSFYLSNNFIKETFPFLIKKEKFDICLNNVKSLNSDLNLKIKESTKYAKVLISAEDHVKKSEKNYNINTNTSTTPTIRSRLYTYHLERQSDLQEFIGITKKESKNCFLITFEIIYEKKEKIFLTMKFLVLFLSIFMIYYGCTFNIEIVFDDVYIGTALFFSAELVGQYLCCYILPYYGRVISMQVTFGLSAIIFLFMSIIGNGIIKLLLFYFGILFISFNITVLYILTTESFEVEIKNTVMSLLTNISCLFLMIFPKIIQIFPNVFILFSLSCILSFYVLRDIKETLRRDL